jgi:hypothetical protein
MDFSRTAVLYWRTVYEDKLIHFYYSSFLTYFKYPTCIMYGI